MRFISGPWNIDDVKSLIIYGSNFLITLFMSDGFPYPCTSVKAKTSIEEMMNRAICRLNPSGEVHNELIYTILI